MVGDVAGYVIVAGSASCIEAFVHVTLTLEWKGVRPSVGNFNRFHTTQPFHTLSQAFAVNDKHVLVGGLSPRQTRGIALPHRLRLVSAG